VPELPNSRKSSAKRWFNCCRDERTDGSCKRISRRLIVAISFVRDFIAGPSQSAQFGGGPSRPDGAASETNCVRRLK
jgi:hypothetical protein